MNWFTKLFPPKEKDDWRFVGKLESGYQHQLTITQDWTKQILTYYLYENQFGERKIDVIDDRRGRGDLNIDNLQKDDWVFRNKNYRDTIRPWLDGFRDPEFPSYEQVPVNAFERVLKGKK